MPYQILKTDGTILIELADGITDSISSSISLIGKNVVGFGQTQNSDFIHMLENFAYGIPPISPLTGQLWFDTENNSLNVYNGEWQTLGIITYAATPPGISIQGNLWFDTTTNQLNVNTGTGFITIGPEGVTGFNTTKFVSTNLTDTSNVVHPVIECVVNGEVIAIISGTGFDISYASAVPGFPTVYRGMTFKNQPTLDVLLTGVSLNSVQSLELLNQEQTSFLVASHDSRSESIMQRNSSGNTTVHDLNAVSVTSFNNAGILSGAWSVDTSVIPTTTNAVNLGTQSLSWSNVWSNNINAQNIVSNNLNVTNSILTLATFTNLVSSSNGQTINKFDTDSTLSSDSDNNLSTQKAVKTYVDTLISELTATIAQLQIQLTTVTSGFTPIPSGTIMYTASGTVPPGYLAADGSLAGIDQYYNLYIALGGASSPYGIQGASFRLPDVRGYFVRGLDNGAGIDVGRQLGSIQQDQIIAHSHQYFLSGGPAPQSGNSTNCLTNPAASTTSTSVVGGSETRPKNIALFGIIKI
jgi:microcystin-dependent protein